MKNLLFSLLACFCLTFGYCQQINNETKVKPSCIIQIFRYENDTINQTVEISEINRDTLNVIIKTHNLKRNTSCLLTGIAVRDTIGDFLEEEETVQDENGKVYSVTDYIFKSDSINLLVIQIDRIESEKLVYNKIESAQLSDDLNCLFYSLGTLRKKSD